MAKNTTSGIQAKIGRLKVKKAEQQMKMDRINYEKEIPKAFTPEKYMEVFVTIWKAVRHEMYLCLSGNSKSLEGAEWKARFEEVYKKVHADFEVFRRDTYEFVTGRKGDAKEIKKIMQNRSLIKARCQELMSSDCRGTY